MAAVDPTYPLYPIASLLASVMLLLVLLTSFVRQSWNLGVALLCFWLFWQNLAQGINTIIWHDNADIKLYVYCDIVSHMQMIASVVKSMATLIITRRLYMITSLRSIEPPTTAKMNCKWILGLGIPLLVAWPLYYVVQGSRFQVDEGFGCTNTPDGSILNVLLTQSWLVIPPTVSITVYYPHVARIFYRHGQEINHFLQSNDSVNRTNYFRILALASIDILLTLPLGIATIALIVKDSVSFGTVPFYFGWTHDHTEWQPQSYSYASIVSQGTSALAQFYFVFWTSPILAFVIFGLFGVTSEARASYWRIICTICGWIGWKPTLPTRRARSPLGDIEFGERPAQNSMSLGLDCANVESKLHQPDARAQEQDGEGRVANEAENGSENDAIQEVRQSTAEKTFDERPTQPSASSQADFGDVSAEV
ncbi:unnamed protein product [Peniophora sp. CBMAI 1063]|nr:unnamed protein product [Peniophora sp. CBMAI 1063]